jgi:hypothetical protein
VTSRERVALQWPKECQKCHRHYMSRAEWRKLPLARTENARDGRYTDAFATHEMRHCPCGTTLVIFTAIHDPGAE